MRMKFLRILPETCVNTSWLFSSLTLNMALGSVSMTVAITSIASSFDKPYPASGAPAPLLETERLLLGQDSRSGVGDRHRVLEVSTHTAVAGHRGPSVLEDADLWLAGVDHGLDGDDHAGTQLHATTRLTKVRHLRILVHVRSDTVPYKIPYFCFS